MIDAGTRYTHDGTRATIQQLGLRAEKGTCVMERKLVYLFFGRTTANVYTTVTTVLAPLVFHTMNEVGVHHTKTKHMGSILESAPRKWPSTY